MSQSIQKINGVSQNYATKDGNTKRGVNFYGCPKVPNVLGVVSLRNLTNSTVLAAAMTELGLIDIPRTVNITVVDTTPSIVAGKITVNGYDMNGELQSEVFDITAGAGLIKAGFKVFAHLTSVVVSDFAAAELDGAGDETYIVTWHGATWGVPVPIGAKLVGVTCVCNGAIEPTVAIDKANNSVVFTSANNGTRIFWAEFEYEE